MEPEYKIGDKTPNGWEVMGVKLEYRYKIRKRIKITGSKYWDKDMKRRYCYGAEVWYYHDKGTKWLEDDNGRMLKFRLRDDEFKYIEYEPRKVLTERIKPSC